MEPDPLIAATDTMIRITRLDAGWIVQGSASPVACRTAQQVMELVSSFFDGIVVDEGVTLLSVCPVGAMAVLSKIQRGYLFVAAVATPTLDIGQAVNSALPTLTYTPTDAARCVALWLGFES